MKSFKQFIEQVKFPIKGGYVTSPTGEKIRSMPVPADTDSIKRPMPIEFDRIPTPLEIRTKNFWKKGTRV